MSIKPVALFGGTRSNDSEIWARRLKDWELPARDTELYAIPDTHRVVPVELLEKVLFRGWRLPVHLEDAVRAIIDNKGAT